MVGRCPGQDTRNLRVETHMCPSCGSPVEIFSDEQRIKCQKCGKYVYREKTPSCIEWCASARQCLGEERWKQLNPDRNNSEDERSAK
jgi:NADH pyrophosphatase NudC (nudix superfamily)